MFFKRLSRSRSNSQSYVDSYHSPHDSKANSQTYDDKYTAESDPNDPQQQPPGSRQSNHPSSAPASASYKQQSFDTKREAASKPNMYRQGATQDAGSAPQYPGSPTIGRAGMANGYARDGGNSYDGMGKQETAPDLLTQAFNLALKPHVEKVDTLESEIADLRAYIDQLELQRNDVHAWIDKRGLRPGEFTLLLSLSTPTNSFIQTYLQA